MSIVFIFLGLLLLVVGGEFLVRSSVGLSYKLNISKMVIGLTVVSFATSAPELIVSLNAALSGFSDIALGNVIGSNVANLGLVLGITATISTLSVDKDFLKLNWPSLIIMSLLLFVFLLNDNTITRIEGIALLIALAIYIFILLNRAKTKTSFPPEDGIDQGLAKTSYSKIFIWLTIGGVALWGGSELLVKGAVDLATTLGISERVIAVTMIAVGTSVPELAASVIAAFKKEQAISLGNLIGSNIFNIGSVLGITSLILPIQAQSDAVVSQDMYWLLGFAFILLPLAVLPKVLKFSCYKGVLLFISYCVFIGLAFLG